MVSKSDAASGSSEAVAAPASGSGSDPPVKTETPAPAPSSPLTRQADETRARQDYDQLCRDLNMDTVTSQAAWRRYEQIRTNYTLEGNQLHWLACALYVACHTARLAMVGRQGMVEGNGVSLTRLLRSCKLSLIQFFNKAKKWADMSSMNSEFRERIDSLERNFAVSSVIFKKYQPIFVHLFKDPAMDPPKEKRSRKQKKPPCTPGEVFDFCWGLFVRVKTDFPAISDDLVNSYHLLLSCVDFIYANAVLGQRTDLLNEKFAAEHPNLAAMASAPGTPGGVNGSSAEAPCILDTLCHVHDGINAEVKSIREHWWKPHIKKFFAEKLLRGEERNISGILDPAHFETNSKNVRKDYESYVLSIGEYDERVFLCEDANEEIGTPSKLSGVVSSYSANPSGSDTPNELLGEKMLARRNLATQFDGSGLIPVTPLSGKHYLKAKEQLKVTPVSTATYLVSRLNSLLGKREAEPSARLADLFRATTTSGGEAVAESIAKRVKKMSETFCENYTASSDQHPGSHYSFARMRLKMGVILYYKLLEAILFSEKDKRKPLANLLENDHFHHALFTCCLEIVIFSYNSQRTFPWILDTFKLEAAHFYKVIEVIIRNEGSLPRDVVKHLQRIEEQILESRAWTSDSSIWEAIEKDPNCHGEPPSCEEVCLPGTSVGDALIEPVPGQSPLSHHKRPFSVIKSPLVGGDRFKSPVVAAVARRQLAFSDSSGGAGGGNGPSQITPTSPLRTGQQSLLASPQRNTFSLVGRPDPSNATMRSIGNNRVLISSPGGPSDSPVSSAAPSRPKRIGSLALFFRKVYHLAHLRLDFLCRSLQIFDEDAKRKIWTTFEHTLIKHTDLMRDRHLDQLLMCSVYIVCKVVGKDKKFEDILKHYREQPQSADHIYRSVLLWAKSSDASTAPAAATKKTSASANIVDGEVRDNLIVFYNAVFLERLKDFSLKFKRSRQSEAPPLSPLPKLRAHQQSPCKKISETRSVYIRPLKSTPVDVVQFNPQSPHKPLSYSFCRSPAKDLAAINALMRNEVERKSAIGKRLLTDEAPASSNSQTTTTMLSFSAAATTTANPSDNGQPPAKIQILGGATAGAVNTKLGLIIGDRAQATD